MALQKNILKSNNLKEEAVEKEEFQQAVEPKKAKDTKKVKAKKPKKPKKVKATKEVDGRIKKLFGLLFLFVALYLFLAFLSFFINWFSEITDDYFAKPTVGVFVTESQFAVQNWTGNLGALLAQFLAKDGFGLGAFFISFLFVVAAIRLLFNKMIISAWGIWKYAVMSLLWLPVLMALLFRSHPLNVLGGALGKYVYEYLFALIGQAGVIILVVFLFLAYLIMTFKMSFQFKRKKEKEAEAQEKIIQESPIGDKYNTEEYAVDDEDDPEFVSPLTGEGNKIKEDSASIELEIEEPSTKSSEEAKASESSDIHLDITPAVQEKVKTKGTVEHQGLDTPYDPRLDLADFKFPPLDLLNMYGDGTITVDRNELEANKNRIVETLGNYSIGIDKIKATPGPTVTLYEIVPAPGVRISRIKSLEDDIALSLSAIGIRIIAPIPGKGTVGIEVPNQKPEIVSMRSIIGSEKFLNNKYELPFGLGKNIANESFVADLTRMPHILMAGATGQGKSVGLNAIITSLLYCKHPAELKFVLVDPKKVELSLFNKIERHYLAKLPDADSAIITDTRKVVRTLNSLSIEMDARYDLLKDAQVRNIKEYNDKFVSRRLNPMEGHRFLPYIVLVVDEFADLIMTAGKEVEGPITRLAQLARAVGIHLIIATQRPSVNIITGTIKANFPARIAFRVISNIDSRTILDSGGADQLVGRGDMLLSTGNELIRLQCAFVDTPEVERVTEFIGSQRGYPDAFHLPEFAEEQDDVTSSVGELERDELFEDAARIIVQNQQGSTSLLQRRLKLGYNRAGRIIDQLEAAGIVGPFEGSKAREVKIGSEMALEQFLKDLYSRSNDEF